MEVINYDCVPHFDRDYIDPYPPRGQQPEPTQPKNQRLLDPAVSLPIEIISCIFEKYVEFMSAPFSCPSKGPWHYPRDAYRVVLPAWVPLRLGAVCQRWRQFAWATPCLWTELLVDVRAQKFNCAMVDLVRQWIDRSGILPMRIRLFKSGYYEYNNTTYWSHNDCVTDFMNMINELAPRWRSIDFDKVPIELTSKLCDTACTEGQPSILNSITLGGYSLDPSDRNMLTRVDTFTRWRHVHWPTHVSMLHPLSLNPTNVNIDWGRVAHLHFDRLTYQHIEHSAKLPALQFLSVFIPADWRYPWLTHPDALHPVIELPALISFSLRSVYDYPTGVVFAHLSLPNLRHLEYAQFDKLEDRHPYTSDRTIMSELVDLIHRRSSREIQDLTVRSQFLSDLEWKSLLEPLRSLHKLAVEMSEWNETAGFLDKLAEYQYGPWNFSLDWLEVTACAPESWASFFQLLEGTSEPLSPPFIQMPSPTRAPKITLTVISERDDNSLRGDISPYMDESELHRLVQLWKNYGIFCQFGDDSYLKETYFDIDGHKIFGNDTDEDLELLRTMSALKF